MNKFLVKIAEMDTQKESLANRERAFVAMDLAQQHYDDTYGPIRRNSTRIGAGIGAIAGGLAGNSLMRGNLPVGLVSASMGGIIGGVLGHTVQPDSRASHVLNAPLNPVYMNHPEALKAFILKYHDKD